MRIRSLGQGHCTSHFAAHWEKACSSITPASSTYCLQGACSNLQLHRSVEFCSITCAKDHPGTGCCASSRSSTDHAAVQCLPEAASAWIVHDKQAFMCRHCKNDPKLSVLPGRCGGVQTNYLLIFLLATAKRAAFKITRGCSARSEEGKRYSHVGDSLSDELVLWMATLCQAACLSSIGRLTPGKQYSSYRARNSCRYCRERSLGYV